VKYMLIMSGKWGEWDEKGIAGWPAEAVENHMSFMRDVNKDLQARGEFVQGEGLAPPDKAKIVNADEKGAPVVSDGPFAESKEFLAGWWILDVEDEQRAIDIATRISTAPGPDGKPLNMAVEVREVMRIPGEEM
jgi:hypothetical protein